MAREIDETALVGVVEYYQARFRETGFSLSTVETPKSEQVSVRFDALVRNLALRPGDTLLDYGCGLGHFLEYVRARSLPVTYSGVDLVPEFIASDRERFPGADFAAIRTVDDVLGDYDHIVLSGVFGVRYGRDFDAHWAIVRRTLASLFARTKKTLTVNFMTDMVDFMQLRAFHLNPADCCRFVQETLSRRVVLDQSYMPYEYTVTVHKDDAFHRPSNVYGSGAAGSSAPNGIA